MTFIKKKARKTHENQTITTFNLQLSKNKAPLNKIHKYMGTCINTERFLIAESNQNSKPATNSVTNPFPNQLDQLIMFTSIK